VAIDVYLDVPDDQRDAFEDVGIGPSGRRRRSLLAAGSTASACDDHGADVEGSGHRGDDAEDRERLPPKGPAR
jgi:hypothetical protein